MTQPKPGTVPVASDKPPQNEVHPSDVLLPFPDVRQLADFTKGREAGSESMFRMRHCDNCRKEIPKQFRFCSEDCQTAVLGEAKDSQ